MTACAYCGENRPLKRSHLIPSFIQRRLRSDADQGYMRAITNMNLRLQQAFVKPWLCHEHEQMFCRDERYFAETIDRPWANGTLDCIEVSEQTIRFLSGLAWKITAWDFDDDGIPGPTEFFHINWARHMLRESLERATPLPPLVEHHLYFPQQYEGPNANINVVYHGSINATIIGPTNAPFTFAALGGFVAITLLNAHDSNRQGWDRGTRVTLGDRLDIRSQSITNTSFASDIKEIGRQISIARDNMTIGQRSLMSVDAKRHEQRWPNSRVYAAARKDRENNLQFNT